MIKQPNILFVMTDQQRFDTIASLGNTHIYTPNIDRLVRRGLAFTNAYSTCPICIPARYTIRTGCEPPTLRFFSNRRAEPVHGQADSVEGRCGPYLAKRIKQLGYRTFGIGKFHSSPWNEDLGYDIHLHSEELYNTPEQRAGDAYASWLHREHPEYDHLEGLMGERTEMYYMPQMSPQPADCAVEAWVTARTVEQIAIADERPYFGFVSFLGPHPPFAPPIPFNRMYDPDRMPSPVRGDIETDHMDQQIPWMNDIIWAESINDPHARILKARYYGEISYIDYCLGSILDAVDSQENADNTLICFFADHGEHLGDHHGWQKESYFDASTRIPFLVSWPIRLPQNQCRSELVCLTDLFAVATHAAGRTEKREGIDLLSVIAGSAEPRDAIVGYHGLPGTGAFKIMVRDARWKYIFFANGGQEQLFDLENDPNELCNSISTQPDVAARLRQKAISACCQPGAQDALESDDFKVLPFTKWEWKGERIYQFDSSRGIFGFPENPGDVLQEVKQPRTARLSEIQTDLKQPQVDRLSEIQMDLKRSRSRLEQIKLDSEKPKNNLFKNEPNTSGLGIDLNAGDEHYRAYVGPPKDYDLVSAMVFNLLTSVGLRQHQRVLDIGCGSLRVGRLLIPYLNPGNYFGIEPNKWLVEDGILNEIGSDLVKLKSPTFSFQSSMIDFKSTLNIDYAIAQSIFSHCGKDLLKKWLEQVSFHLKDTGALLATFLIDQNDFDGDGWIYPGCVKYKPETMAALALEYNLDFELIDWAHPRQSWALFSKNNFDKSLISDEPISWNRLINKRLFE